MRRQPDRADLWCELANLYSHTGEADGAAHALTTADSIAAEMADGRRLVAQVEQTLKTGVVEEAARIANRLALQSTGSPRQAAAANIIVGYAFARQRRWEEAEQALQLAVSLDEGYGKAHRALGNLYAEQSRDDGASDAYQRAIATDPNFRDAHYGFAMIYARRDNFSKAMTQLETLVESNSTYARAYYALGNLHEQQGAVAEALAVCDRFVRHWRGDPGMLEAVETRMALLRSKL